MRSAIGASRSRAVRTLACVLGTVTILGIRRRIRLVLPIIAYVPRSTRTPVEKKITGAAHALLVAIVRAIGASSLVAVVTGALLFATCGAVQVISIGVSACCTRNRIVITSTTRARTVHIARNTTARGTFTCETGAASIAVTIAIVCEAISASAFVRSSTQMFRIATTR